jgi:hypothetical protein
MRITGGKLGGRRLVTPQDASVRPTSDRTRQAIFNMLRHKDFDIGFELEGAAVADLFAARGATTVAAGTTPVLDRNGNPMTGITVRVTTSTSTITRQGIAERLAAEIDRFVKPTDGLITRSNKTLDDQVKAQTTKIADLDARLERRRTILQRQFLAMEEAIGKLQSQSGAVGGIRALQ